MSDKTLGASIGFNSLLLGLFAVITTGVLAFTYAGTQERIVQQKQRAQLSALSEILPQRYYDNDLIDEGAIVIPREHWQLLNLDAATTAFIATKSTTTNFNLREQDRPVAIIFPTKGNGYSGAINMLVGVFADGSVAGVRVTQHAETPGLGDYIDIRKSDWISTFDGKSLANPPADAWDTRNYGGEFDGLTSATITSRAVIHQVKSALEYFAEQQPLQSLPARSEPSPAEDN